MRLNVAKLAYGMVFLTVVLVAWRTVEKSNERETILDYANEDKIVEGQILSSSEAGQSKQGYVLTLKFTGQQAAGLRGIFSQQCWLKLFGFPMSIVEPFVSESVLCHSKKFWKEFEEGERARNRLSCLYQMPQDRLGLPITRWETFLSVAPKKIIVLTIQNPFAKGCLVFNRMSCVNKAPLNQHRSSNCSQTADVLDAICYLKTKSFVVVRKVCLICDEALHGGVSPKDITEYIFEGYKPKDVTLLINKWKFTFEITPDCKRGQCHHAMNMLDNILPPPKLARDAYLHREFLKNKLGYTNNENKSWPSIAIMIRLEWFVITKKEKSIQDLKLCFADIKATISTISSNTSNEVLILLALDIGKFGSGTFESTKKHNSFSTEFITSLEKEVKRFVYLTYKKRINFDEWEESFENVTGGKADRGYIAALQGQEAKNADCLILMGGGHFQILALQQYVKSKPYKNCIHTICMPSSFDSKISKIVELS